MKIRGKREQITKCIFHICSILMEHPPKGNLIKKAFRSNIYIYKYIIHAAEECLKHEII